MNLTRIVTMLAVSVGLVQSQSNPPAFEVASVKPHPLEYGRVDFRIIAAPGPTPIRATGNRFTDKMATLQDLVMQAYGVRAYQIVNLPDWAQTIKGEQYDIDARAAGEAQPSESQLRAMLQSLLAERFQLRLHREMKDLPVYALVIGKNGTKLRERTATIKTTQTREEPAALPTIAALVFLLAHYVDLPVVDETGLTGDYEYVDLNWRQLAEERVSDPMAAQESVFSAIQDQLGLKLERRREPLEILVIDNAARPSAN
jgi:uncharacterized protein (TIGR03435 family)